MPIEYYDAGIEPLYLCPNGVAVDAGANVGMHARAMARHMRLVMAFEPDPSNFEELMRTLALDALANVLPIRAALGAEPGLLPMLSAGGQTRRQGLTSGFNPHVAAEFTATVLTLDDVCRDLGRLDVLKIDVEGMELDVLRGARETLARLGPTVIVENHDAIEPGYQTCFADVVDLLGGLGYRGMHVSNQNHAFRR